MMSDELKKPRWCENPFSHQNVIICVNLCDLWALL